MSYGILFNFKPVFFLIYNKTAVQFVLKYLSVYIKLLYL